MPDTWFSVLDGMGVSRHQYRTSRIFTKILLVIAKHNATYFLMQLNFRHAQTH